MDIISKNNEVIDEANAAEAIAWVMSISEKCEIKIHPAKLPKTTTSKMNKVNFQGSFPAFSAV
jgi:hypothetical protein